MKIKVTIPERQEEITVAQYMAYQSLLSEDDLKEDFLAQKVVEIFCKVSWEQVRKMPLQDIGVITEKVAKALNEKPKLIRRFNLNRTTYGFIPDLDLLTFGEYIDLDTFFTKEEDLHRALNVLYRPIATTLNDMYTIKEYDPGKANALKQMPLNVALGAIDFFFRLSEELLANTVAFSEKKARASILRRSRDLPLNTAGTRAFTP